MSDDPKDNLRKFEASQRDEKKPEFTLPPVIDICTGPPGTKICPIMPSQILVMPVNPSKSALQVNQQPQSAFVRQYTPCVRESCMAWHKYMPEENANADGYCKLINN